MAIEFEPQPASTHRHDQFEVVADGLGRYTIDISLPAELTTDTAIEDETTETESSAQPADESAEERA